VGVTWLLLLIGHLHLLGVWLGKDQGMCTAKKTHISKRLDYIFKFINYSIPNNEQIWKDLCIV
jgi:hypothetical protein